MDSFLIGLTIFFTATAISFNFLPKTKIFQLKAKNKNVITVKPTPTPRFYIIQEGDDLWLIAQKFYGSGFNAYDIAQANNLDNIDNIHVGNKLVIPNVTPKLPTEGEVSQSAATTSQVVQTGTTYVVQPGDFLWQIAVNFYGDGMMQNKIIDANEISYPYNVEVGQKLIIPR
jgi:nucleoid-associated protein YgaU